MSQNHADFASTCHRLEVSLQKSQWRSSNKLSTANRGCVYAQVYAEIARLLTSRRTISDDSECESVCGFAAGIWFETEYNCETSFYRLI